MKTQYIKIIKLRSATRIIRDRRVINEVKGKFHRTNVRPTSNIGEKVESEMPNIPARWIS